MLVIEGLKSWFYGLGIAAQVFIVYGIFSFVFLLICGVAVKIYTYKNPNWREEEIKRAKEKAVKQYPWRHEFYAGDKLIGSCCLQGSRIEDINWFIDHKQGIWRDKKTGMLHGPSTAYGELYDDDEVRMEIHVAIPKAPTKEEKKEERRWAKEMEPIWAERRKQKKLETKAAEKAEKIERKKNAAIARAENKIKAAEEKAKRKTK